MDWGDPLSPVRATLVGNGTTSQPSPCPRGSPPGRLVGSLAFRFADGDPPLPTATANELAGTGRRVRAAGCAVRRRPPGREPIVGPSWRGRDREDGPAGVPDRGRVGPDGHASD